MTFMSSKSKIDDTTITVCKKYQNKLLWKKFTCTLLCSKARSSSCLAAAVSCWWVWRMCSMADAWRWFSSERRDAERRTRERDSVNGKTRLFQGDERLSGAELNIIHLQLSLKHKRHRWKWKWHSFPPPAISCLHFLIMLLSSFFQLYLISKRLSYN